MDECQHGEDKRHHVSLEAFSGLLTADAAVGLDDDTNYADVPLQSLTASYSGVVVWSASNSYSNSSSTPYYTTTDEFVGRPLLQASASLRAGRQ